MLLIRLSALGVFVISDTRLPGLGIHKLTA